MAPTRALLYAIHHVFLPPKLPQVGDGQDTVHHDLALQSLLAESIQEIEPHLSLQEQHAARTISDTCKNMGLLKDSKGHILEEELLTAFRNLKSDNILLIHVEAQNAGILVSRVGEQVYFETLELSPPNSVVMGENGRLRRCFPGPSASIPFHEFQESGFQQVVASTIATLSRQPVPEMKPTARKAGQDHIEERDTTNPKMVTKFLVTVLAAIGTPVDPPRFWKNTREEVLWSDALLPWRRSPTWLLIRVAMQAMLSRLGTAYLYKGFMAVFMTHVLSLAVESDAPGDILHCMLCKISHRVRKITQDDRPRWLSTVDSTLGRVIQQLQDRWANIGTGSDSDFNMLDVSSLQFEDDVAMSLPELDKLLEVMKTESSTRTMIEFHPPSVSINPRISSPPSLETDDKNRGSISFQLACFELWVAKCLEEYLWQSSPQNGECKYLLELLKSYHCTALRHYLGNPESLSIMILTCVELWIACDTLVTEAHPLLLDYDPEIPATLLQSLLLPLESQMKRLSTAEVYITNRQSRAKQGHPSVFTAFGTPDCLSVRFFANSLPHQNLLKRIETEAMVERQLKIAELATLKAQYNRLMKSFRDATRCDLYVVYDSHTKGSKSEHSPSCTRCSYRRQAEQMSISIYEWPLPRSRRDAESTVFELDVPSDLGAWRDVTMFLILDVFCSEWSPSSSENTGYGLGCGLSRFWVLSDRRLSLVSTTKPHSVTHRRQLQVSLASEDDVCVNNGLTFHYWDSTTNRFTTTITRTDNVAKMCMYHLPKVSSGMQDFIFRPPHQPNGLTPNTVISRQSQCPDHMSLEEFKALATIPIGYRIQWRNILVQLFIPAVDFKKVETGLVLLQASRQAGPPSQTVARESHEDLQDASFASDLIRGLTEGLRRIKENWESCQALSSFVSLATRLLSLAPSDLPGQSCLGYLAECRGVALGWARSLHVKAQECMDDQQRLYLLLKTLEVAQICISTFDVDSPHLKRLIATPSEAAGLMESSIIIQETSTCAARSAEPYQRILTQRWERLMYRACPILLEEFTTKRNTGLDTAIHKSWSAYAPNAVWKSASDSEHWLFTTTSGGTGSDTLIVHFNLLTAELLVNGLPLSRLPPPYEGHTLYKIFFGQATVDVLQTNERGMEFSAKRQYHGHNVFLGMRMEGGQSIPDLKISTFNAGKWCDLLPSRVLNLQLPEHFIRDYVHWYDRKSAAIEFRPLRAPWDSSTDHWRLVRTVNYWTMVRGLSSLISVKSRTARVVSRVLRPLEANHHIHMLLNPTSCELKIELPRVKLSFGLVKGSSTVLSHQLRGMCIDASQQIGTLVGLDSKLVLKDSKGHRRAVFVPNGPPSWKKTDNHVSVAIRHGTSTKIHSYWIDDLLGRMIDDGTLQSKLTLCQLHAITSSYLPDHLTSMTGTEQALVNLRSAAVGSFENLAEEDINTLVAIARLSPLRQFYPIHERLMQKVSWDEELSFLTQSEDLFLAAETLLEQSASVRFFYPEYPLPPALDFTTKALVQRALTRNASFKIWGLGAEHHTGQLDQNYNTRDEEGIDAERVSNVFNAVTMLFHQAQTLQNAVTRSFSTHMWQLLSSENGTEGPVSALDSCFFRYDAAFLGDPGPIFAEYWCRIHRVLGQSPTATAKFDKIIFLATLAFSKWMDMQSLQTLIAVVNLPSVGLVTPPYIPTFNLSKGRSFDRSHIEKQTKSLPVRFEGSEEAALPRRKNELIHIKEARQRDLFARNMANTAEIFVNELEAQWPCEFIKKPTGERFAKYIETDVAMFKIQGIVQMWFNNLQFWNYLQTLQSGLQRIPVATAARLPYSMFPLSTPAVYPRRPHSFITETELFARIAPLVSTSYPTAVDKLVLSAPRDDSTHSKLSDMVDRLESKAKLRREEIYVRDLRKSLECFRGQTMVYTLQSPVESLQDSLQTNLIQCRENVQDIYSQLVKAIAPGELAAVSTCASTSTTFQMPRVSSAFILRQLSRTRWSTLSIGWKLAVVQYGVALTKLRRAERLVDLQGNNADLIQELLNSGHKNWHPAEHPESLLLEVESGIMIRDVQEEIARHMRTPPKEGNAVLQLNMGEGKSSVIAPMVAAALADVSQLVHVIVAKPQSKQMFQMLVSKLGGLCDRRIVRMPFSRSLRLAEADAQRIYEIYRQCMTDGSILLVQPEHILSFQLMGIESLISGRLILAERLLRTQRFLNTHSRDIVDESDENFSVKFELIYTMGAQNSVELSPDRWILIQSVLGLVAEIVPQVAVELPFSIEIEHSEPGRFPRTRILRHDAEQLLLGRLADKICSVGLPNLPIARQPCSIQQAVRKYITEPDLTDEDIKKVEVSSGFWTESTRNPLLLVRGLIAGGVLGFALREKRWTVNYGLDLDRRPRTMLAVPFRAKDSPTARSEFSHPDVVMILTCLSYYYGGLGSVDMETALDHLVRSDQADIEYQDWVADAPDLAPGFRQLIGINLKDHFQCVSEVFPRFKWAKRAIDYFLARIVFPKEIKEFPHKLSSSGWDIGQTKKNPTTGFSGTNDGKHLLPLAVSHLDLEKQRHTNALVLEYLLQPENTIQLMWRQNHSEKPDAERLLDLVTGMQPQVQVILDIGAQVLELSNVQVVRAWLAKITQQGDKQAAVFFNDNDELCVIDRKNIIEPLQTSPYAKQLDMCVIFLDEAHTRGTDLKMPAYYRAAVTLGPNLTKDKLVQGCMRMRKLGHGQSVVFCISEEIQAKIIELTGLTQSGIGVSDVLEWAIHETGLDLQRSMPLWASQGLRFEQQKAIWAMATTNKEIELTQEHAGEFLEDEAQSLDRRYRPKAVVRSAKTVPSPDINPNIQAIRDRCTEFNSSSLALATLQEEQERELSPEIEQERQVQRPPAAEPLKHDLHPNVVNFVRTGTIASDHTAFLPAFHALQNTSAALHLDVTQFPRDLLATRDFTRTVQLAEGKDFSDAYQRSVQWVLTSNAMTGAAGNAVIISPFEAQELIPQLKTSRAVYLHLYSARPNLAFRSLDSLTLQPVPQLPINWALPSCLIIQLNLFSGQLYFNSYEQYKQTCDFLSLAWGPVRDGETLEADGFVMRNSKGIHAVFVKSPIRFMKTFMTKVRRNCEDIDKTHWGKVLGGQILAEKDFRPE